MTALINKNSLKFDAVLALALTLALPSLSLAQNAGASGTGGSGSASSGSAAGSGTTGTGVGNGAGSTSSNAAGSQSTVGGQSGNGGAGEPSIGSMGNQTGNDASSQNTVPNNGSSSKQTTGQVSNQSGASTSMSQPGNQSNGVSGSMSGQMSTSNRSSHSLTSQATPRGAGLKSQAPPTPSTYDLGSAIQATIQSSSDLAIAEKNLAKDQALVAATADRNHPRIEASGTYTHLDSPIAIQFGAQRVVVQPKNTQALDAAGTLPLDISGQVKAATQAAELQVMADRFDFDRIKNGLTLNAQDSYFNELRAQHQVQVDQSALTDAETQLKTTQTQYAGGIGQKIDVYRASTQVSEAQQSLLKAQNALALAQTNFNDVVGRDLSLPVTVEDVPGVTVGTSISGDETNAPVGAPDPAVSVYFTPPTTEINEINLQSDIDTALKARPELREDQVNVQAASKQITLARATSEPTLSLGATGDYYPVTDFQTPRHSLGVFSATLNIPIFDGGTSRDQMKAARDERDEFQLSYESDQTNVELQVRQAFLNLYTTANQISAANSALQQAIAARQLAEVRYRNGVGLYLEVTDAEAALTSAESSQVNAVYDYLVARAQYQNAVGTPSTNPAL